MSLRYLANIKALTILFTVDLTLLNMKIAMTKYTKIPKIFYRSLLLITNIHVNYYNPPLLSETWF